jgi:hypothetical protein
VQNVCKPAPAALEVSGLSLVMLFPEEHDQRIHLQALRGARAYRKVLVAGLEKSLAALSRDLFAAGCSTGEGKPLTPEMVRRLRFRLYEALLAFASGELEDESAEWDPLYEIEVAIQQRNRLMLRWYLRMVRKELGDTIAVHVEQILMGSKHASWVHDALGQA